MPQIIIDAINNNTIIKEMTIAVDVRFSHEYFNNHYPKAEAKLVEMKEKFEQIIEEYFQSDYSSDSEMKIKLFHLRAI